jgi:hypothetical protein
MNLYSCGTVLRWFVLGLALTGARLMIVFTFRRRFGDMEAQQPDNCSPYEVERVYYDDV